MVALVFGDSLGRMVSTCTTGRFWCIYISSSTRSDDLRTGNYSSMNPEA
jgi:hypothetical protein